ncbi:MAG: hypothetical protein JW395_4180 [Nitrospira sp.]|nr:hypothetical protein [Nitrospira sp.]
MSQVHQLIATFKCFLKRLPSVATQGYLFPLNVHQRRLHSDPSKVFFPLDIKGREFFGNSFQVGTGIDYLVGLYDLPEPMPSRFEERPFHVPVEILPGQVMTHTTVLQPRDRDAFLPVARDVGTHLPDLRIGNQDHVFAARPRRFVYLKVPSGTEVTVAPRRGKRVFVGEPIDCENDNEPKVPRVLCLFVDGLSSMFMHGTSFDAVMPHTAEFFFSGTHFTDFATSAEWTLPSMSSLFTAKYPHNHRIIDPRGETLLDTNQKILSEYFQSAGYLCSQFGSNWRMTPAHGYARGFDRTLYSREESAPWMINEYLEFLEAFPERSHFSWLTLFGLHQPWPKRVPQISVQTKATNEYLLREPYGDQKSVKPGRDPNRIQAYTEALRQMDRALGRIYDFVNRSDGKQEWLITLVADHGQSYFSDEPSYLADQRTRVPWLIRGPGVPQLSSREMVETVDILPTLLRAAGLSEALNLMDGRVPAALGGDEPRKYSFTESLFPSQPYVCRFRDGRDWLEITSSVATGDRGEVSPTTLRVSAASSSGYVGGICDAELLDVAKRLIKDAGT